jgi:hypothetical protein
VGLSFMRHHYILGAYLEPMHLGFYCVHMSVHLQCLFWVIWYVCLILTVTCEH